MAAQILKTLDEIKLTGKLKGTIKSGFKSDDSDAELLIAEPLKPHPEIEGLYRAYDPNTGWRTWVEYTPPVEPAPPVDETKKEIRLKTRELEEKLNLVHLGVFTEQELEIQELQEEIKQLYGNNT